MFHLFRAGRTSRRKTRRGRASVAHRRMTAAAVFALAASAALRPSPVCAEPQQPANPAPQVNPLAGPSVGGDDAAGGATIVVRDFSGKIKRPDMRPEVAALQVLSLSPAEREATGQVLAQRAAMLDTLVRENIDLLLRAQTARESDDRAEKQAVLKETTRVFAPLGEGGTLEVKLAAALEPANATKFRAVLREYWRARAREAAPQRDDKPPPKKPAAQRQRGDEPMRDSAENPMRDAAPESMRDATGDADDLEAPLTKRQRQALVRIAAETLGQEVRRSYEGLAADGAARLESVIETLALTDEQQTKVRAIVTEFAQESKLNPTRMQRLRLFLRVSKELTPEQRRKFIDLARAAR
jgi:hypothetical protein